MSYRLNLFKSQVCLTLDKCETGSLVFTSRGNFYIAVHAGTHQLDNQSFFAISPDAPIAQKLMGLTTGDTVSLHHHEFTILELQ